MLIDTVKTSDIEDGCLLPNMKSVRSFETLKTTYQSTQRNISEDLTLPQYTACRLTSDEATETFYIPVYKE